MKKPPFRVAPSQSQFRSRQAKVTTQDHTDKLDQIKEMLPHYLERYWLEKIYRKTETSFQLHCPFHEDKTPSFTADNKKGTWLFKCFSCGRAGSVIDLHAGTAGLDPRSYDAIQATAQAVGIELGQSTPPSPAERREWAIRRREAAKQARDNARKKEEQEKLTTYQRQTLLQKLQPYLSDDWRADLYHSSPLWTETPEESVSAFVGNLFPLDEIIWMGETYDTGQERHRENFRTTREWLKETSLPPRIAAGTFRPGSFSRSKDNLESSPFLIIESDDLIGKKPTNAGERNENKSLSYALAGYCQQELGLHLRAVIDTGNKSLHLWFDQPPPKALAAVRMLAPGLCIDTGLLDSCATAPLRMPGCLHEKTHLPATLLYLNHAAS
ncbi:CHC2 zinc finger domain-containing protein [Akkermansiaceae bacterium]|nr:CHC2 zinc finger domain-containing protein [Akkermansiaceae bacterium]